MLTKNARRVRPEAAGTASCSAVRETALQLYHALGPLHELRADDVDLMVRACAGLALIRSTGAYSGFEHELFGIALGELAPGDAFVVEVAACLASDAVSLARSSGSAASRRGQQRRALWLAALLRIADAVCSADTARPSGVYASWTSEALYLEFDGEELSTEQLTAAKERSGALEVASGRRVYVAVSAVRRGAA